MGRGGQRTITLYLSHILYIHYFFWTCVPNRPSVTPPPQSIMSALAPSYFSFWSHAIISYSESSLRIFLVRKECAAFAKTHRGVVTLSVLSMITLFFFYIQRMILVIVTLNYKYCLHENEYNM